MPATDEFSEQVARGDRFEFGKNWAKFLRRLTVPQIKLAQQSLTRALRVERLDGQRFLDVGSGSGLFSLAARRLGAHVRSFDFDPRSVACTLELRRRYFPEDPLWTVERGSVLDRGYLASLGSFDVVYSWGVLHHTGDMWAALDNVKPLVAPGGQLVVAIYNDQGQATDHWADIKRTYNRLPRPLAAAYAAGLIGLNEGRELARHARQGSVAQWRRYWRDYAVESTRGMSRWHDWIDWIGGWPYERATVERIVDRFACDGFELSDLVDRSTGYGCNEFVFRRVADPGTFVDAKLSGGNSMARRFGARVHAPFIQSADGWSGTVRETTAPVGAKLLLIADDVIVGPAKIVDGRILLPFDTTPVKLSERVMHVVAVTQMPLDPPFEPVRQKLWSKTVADLTELADTQQAPRGSTAFLFEDGSQLPFPHAPHDAIAVYGAGRFSHWETSLYFSTRDGSDPNRNGRSYVLLVAARPLPADRSLAQTHGLPLAGPFILTPAGWVARLPDMPASGELIAIRDDHLLDTSPHDRAGEIVIAPPDMAESAIRNAAFHVVAATVEPLPDGVGPERGCMWRVALPEHAAIADRPGYSGSPLFLFEDGAQLPFPHALHDDIDRLGGGRFSHWENTLYFSTSDGSDPTTNGRRYRIVVPDQAAIGAV